MKRAMIFNSPPMASMRLRRLERYLSVRFSVFAIDGDGHFELSQPSKLKRIANLAAHDRNISSSASSALAQAYLAVCAIATSA